MFCQWLQLVVIASLVCAVHTDLGAHPFSLQPWDSDNPDLAW